VQPARQGFLLLLFLLVLFFWKPLFTGQALLASDLLFEIDPLWQPLAPPGFSTPGNRALSDQALQFYPWRNFAVEQLAQGRLPLWNPYVNGGHPFLANGQSALFDPFNVVTYWIPLDQSMVVVAFLRLLCAGTFTLLLALELGMSRAAAYLAMVVFTFGGPQIVWLLYPKASVLVWLPSLLFFSERLIRTGRGAYVALLGLVIAAQMSGGHPVTSLYVMLVWLAYVGYRLSQLAQTGRSWFDVLLNPGIKLALAGLLGLSASAVQWLPLAEAVWHSESLSSQAPLNWRTIFFPWQAWPSALTLILPDYFGNPRDNSYWYPFSNYNEQTFFAGIVPLCFALLALLMAVHQWGQAKRGAPRRGQIGFFVGLLLVSFVLALKLPGITILTELPGFNLINSPRLRVIYLFALAILAGYGLDLFLQSLSPPGQDRLSVPGRWGLDGSPRRILAWLFAGVALTGALTAAASYLLVVWMQEQLVELGRQQALTSQGNPFFFRPLADYLELAEARVRQMLASFHPSNWRMYLPLFIGGLYLLCQRAVARVSQRAQIMAALVLILCVGELWFAGLNYNPSLPRHSIYPTPNLVQFLQTNDDSIYRIVGVNLALVPNVGMLFHLQDIRGYEPVTPKRYMELVSRLDGAVRVGDHLLFTHANAPFLDFLNVKYAFSSVPLNAAWTPLQQSGEVTLYENRQVMPRAFLVYEGQRAATPEESLAMTLAPDFDFHRSVVLEGEQESGGADLENASEHAGTDALVTVTSYQPEQITVQVDAPAAGFLVLSEPYTPGWVASVDGEPANLLIANHAFRAVRIPAGEHVATFEYRPLSVRWGARMSVMGLVVLLFIPLLWRAPTAPSDTVPNVHAEQPGRTNL
jgi:hypothetical protein